jgi:hypothetical protein
VNGHIIAAANQGLIDIDPVAGTFRVITSNPGADGVSVSPDGATLYAEAGAIFWPITSPPALCFTLTPETATGLTALA